jgi:MarR family
MVNMAHGLGTALGVAVVSVVAEHPGARPGQLARLLHMRPNTVTTIVNALIARGMISRATAGGDRRAVEPAVRRPAPGRLDFTIRVSRARQRQAALRHVSQVSPGAPLWRRLELQGNIEHLRWLVPPPGAA